MAWCRSGDRPLPSDAHISQRHDDVIKWKHFPRYWPFVRRIHRSLINSPHKGQWRGALMFSSICAWINGWINNGEVGDLRRHRAHYDVIVMELDCIWSVFIKQIQFHPISDHTHKVGISHFTKSCDVRVIVHAPHQVKLHDVILF